MKEIEEPDAPEEDELEDDEGDDEVAPVEDAEPGFDEIVAKPPVPEDDEEEESLLTLTREERFEALSIRAAPKQANEFVCANCNLVKHNSQLADRKRQLCRDCV
ncbi:MAG TPA: DUF4193 family protein [Actinomycetota bacterium]|nr:DUF4193 family protein [Actinomycetota bacterium]